MTTTIATQIHMQKIDSNGDVWECTEWAPGRLYRTAKGVGVNGAYATVQRMVWIAAEEGARPAS